MKEIKFVDVGEGITEGHVRKWLVKDGDQVKEDQPVVQVETDKAVVNVPSPIAGTIQAERSEDTDVHLGDTVAYIGTSEELSAIAKAQAGAAKQAARPARLPAPVDAASVMAPKPRRREIHCDPGGAGSWRGHGSRHIQGPGTGPEGRILERT